MPPAVRQKALALLVDMDGVLRRWDPAVIARIESSHGLPPHSLLATALDPDRMRPAITGEVTHSEWMTQVTTALAERYGDLAAARSAVKEWEVYRGEVDPDVLRFVREVRAAGIRVGIGTNATDILDDDLAVLGLMGEVDVVVNSSVLRLPKPSREYFMQACLLLKAPPERVLFVDDSDRFIRGARAAGLSAYRWTGPEDLPYLESALEL